MFTIDPGFEFAEEALIAYPRFNQLYLDILDCQELTRASGEPHCMSIEGDLGVGKSTLIKAFVRASLKDVLGYDISPSGIYVATPESRHPAAMASAILGQLGDRYPDRGRVWAQKRRIKEYIRELNVHTVCFDDFQHMWDTRRDAPLFEESEYFKTLIKETEKTFIVTGITGQITRILDANPQLSSLFAVREILEPFKWDEKHAAEFAKFVSMAEANIGFEIISSISREELLARIHYATNGIPRHLFRLLRGSTLIATREGKSVIDMTHLSQTYVKRLSKQFTDKTNPFDGK